MKAKDTGPTEFQIATENLKAHLRAEKITYRELAAGIGMSESGIKKLLGARDASFLRLSEICRYAGLSVADLLAEQRRGMMEVTFPLGLQDFFLKNPKVFRFYFQLVYERLPLKDLQKSLGLSDKESFRYCRQLDDMNLLKLLPGGELRLPKVKQVKWTGDGPFLRKIYREWSEKVVRRVASPDVTEGQLFILRYLKMQKSTYEQFVAAHRALEKDFVARAISEMRMQSKNLIDMTWVTGATPVGFFAD